MDPRTVRRIRIDTRAVFATLRVQSPGTHRETHSGADKIERRLTAKLLFLRGLRQYYVGKVKSRFGVCECVFPPISNLFNEVRGRNQMQFGYRIGAELQGLQGFSQNALLSDLRV